MSNHKTEDLSGDRDKQRTPDKAGGKRLPPQIQNTAKLRTLTTDQLATSTRRLFSRVLADLHYGEAVNYELMRVLPYVVLQTLSELVVKTATPSEKKYKPGWDSALFNIEGLDVDKI